ncbi:hypothetical protein [Arcobacter arenosus]|uniref:hypothetical protein n=1 Tax=Arcobacter arenosus TaxID=2576037 RepID=UPI0014857C4B|nr:hypothetical protein [Arcobacter arenosus]
MTPCLVAFNETEYKMFKKYFPGVMVVKNELMPEKPLRDKKPFRLLEHGKRRRR